MLETFWKPFWDSLFSSSVAFFMISVASQKRRHFIADIRQGISQKSAEARTAQGIFQCYYNILCYEYLDLNRPVAWGIVVKKKPTFDSQFSGTFPSDCIPKKTNQLTRQKFPTCSKSCTLYQRIPGHS